jgi:hypothetical protein
MAVDEVLYEVALQHEARGMWRVFLDLQVGAAWTRPCFACLGTIEHICYACWVLPGSCCTEASARVCYGACPEPRGASARGEGTRAAS